MAAADAHAGTIGTADSGRIALREGRKFNNLIGLGRSADAYQERRCGGKQPTHELQVRADA